MPTYNDIIEQYKSAFVESSGQPYNISKKKWKKAIYKSGGGGEMPITSTGYKSPLATTNKAVPTSSWPDQKALELQIEKMMKALAFKLKQDGLFFGKHVDMAAIVYNFLKRGRGYDMRFADGDLTLLDEFIDLEWPQLVAASKSQPTTPDGFTELPKSQPTVESLFGTTTVGTNTDAGTYAGIVRNNDFPVYRIPF